MNPELLVKQWLEQDENLSRWPVSFDVPAESTASTPIRCITVELVGDTVDRFTRSPLIAVQVWAETRWMASETANRIVLPRLKRMCELSMVADIDITGMSHMPMPDGRPRYQILIQPTIQTSQ